MIFRCLTSILTKIYLFHYKGAGGAVRSVLPSTSVAVGQIWNNLENVSGKIVSHVNKVKLLWKALLSGKDSVSNLPYIDFLPSGENVFKKFWDNFLEILNRHLSMVKQDFLKSALDNEFPRLLKIISELGNKIEEGGDTPWVNLAIGVGFRFRKTKSGKSIFFRIPFTGFRAVYEQ